MNVLIFVLLASAGVVAVAVAVDAGTSYMGERIPRDSKPVKIKKQKRVANLDADEGLKQAIARYRHIKQRQIGVIFTVSQRPTGGLRTGAAHRKTKVAA